MRPLLLAALLAAPLAAHCQIAPGARVDASYVVSERDPGTERALRDLKLHLEKSAPHVLAPGQQLSVELFSVYRAGHKSWTPGNHGVRVITDSTPARIELAFTLRDAAGATLAGGRRSLRSPDYFVADRGGDPMRFEKELLDDWLRKEFGAPHG